MPFTDIIKEKLERLEKEKSFLLQTLNDETDKVIATARNWLENPSSTSDGERIGADLERYILSVCQSQDKLQESKHFTDSTPKHSPPPLAQSEVTAAEQELELDTSKEKLKGLKGEMFTYCNHIFTRLKKSQEDKYQKVNDTLTRRVEDFESKFDNTDISKLQKQNKKTLDTVRALSSEVREISDTSLANLEDKIAKLESQSKKSAGEIATIKSQILDERKYVFEWTKEVTQVKNNQTESKAERNYLMSKIEKTNKDLCEERENTARQLNDLRIECSEQNEKQKELECKIEEVKDASDLQTENTIKQLDALQMENSEQNEKLRDLETENERTKTTLSNMESELEETKTTLSNMESEMEETKTTLSNMESELEETKTKLSNMESKMEETNTTVENIQSENEIVKRDITNLTDKDVDLEHDINNLQSKTVQLETDVATAKSQLATYRPPQGVGFTARLPDGPLLPASKDLVLKFGDVHNNIGGNYNQTSGEFLAPADGTYLAFVSIMQCEQGEIYASVNHQTQDGSEKPLCHVCTEMGETSSTGVCVAHMKKGEKLFVKIFHVTGSPELRDFSHFTCVSLT